MNSSCPNSSFNACNRFIEVIGLLVTQTYRYKAQHLPDCQAYE